MLYCGVYLYNDSCKISVLSEGFAFLGTKHFTAKDFDEITHRIGYYKINPNEQCVYFFDEENFKKHDACASALFLDDDRYTVYLVNHRKLLGIIRFLYDWVISTDNFSMMDIDQTFVLASARRMFNGDELIEFKPVSSFLW